MSVVSVDYSTFKAVVGPIVGVTVFYAPSTNGKDQFQALAMSGVVAVLYSGPPPETFTVDFPQAVRVLNIYA